MRIQNVSQKTHFTSSIKVINKRAASLAALDAEVIGSPWSANEIIRGVKCFSGDIRSCLAGGFLVKKDGAKAEKNIFDVIFFHLIPKKHGLESSSIAEVHKKIMEKLGKDKIVQAFLFGSTDSRVKLDASGKESQNFFEEMEDYIKTYKVPYTKIKGIPSENDTVASLGYDGTKNLWSVQSEGLFSRYGAPKYFEDIELADCDKFVD